MLLEWKQPGIAIELVWIGPTKITSAISTMEEAQAKIAVISGPRGARGQQGEQGVIGGLPTILDGGNF